MVWTHGVEMGNIENELSNILNRQLHIHPQPQV